MAVVNILANAITNADASPRVANSSYLEGGVLRSSVGTVEVAAADSDGSTYRFCRVPSGARVHSIRVYCDSITAGTSFDFGLYKNAADGGAVVDVDSFSSAVDLSTAITTGTEIRFEAADIAQIEKRMFEQAGVALTVDPFLEYDIVATGNTVGSAAGTISISVSWTL